MRYLKLFESFEEYGIHKICKQYNIRNYTINNDGSIDVSEFTNLSEKRLMKLPLKFNKITNGSDFYCSYNDLTSLKGSPVEVDGGFFCGQNNLTSFKYAPKIIRYSFNCSNNKINSFEYFPSYIGDLFVCLNNPIYWVWVLFGDTTRIELLNDFDMFRDEETKNPAIVMDRLNDFLLTIGKDPVEKIDEYKNI